MRSVVCALFFVLVVVSAAHAHTKKADLLLKAVLANVKGDATTLKDAAALTGRYFGSCLAQSELTNTKLISTLTGDFNCATPENEMKWDATEPSNNTFNWGGADAIFDWTQKNNFLLRGHTLVWYSQLPTWVNNINNVAALQEAMYNHMEVLMARYKGKLYAWDVVNEAFADDGTENLRQSIWTRLFGNSTKYIELAFQHARLQDPDVKLCYNDYSTDGINPKSNGVYNMVKDFKSRGVPIDCVGFQGHLNTYPTATFQQNLQRFADLGVEVYMTELDIQEDTAGGADAQAAAYSAVVGACLNITACKGITVWGVDDGNSWKSRNTPLLWDSNFNKKPAYYSTLDVLNSAASVEEEEQQECAVKAIDMGSRLASNLKFKIESDEKVATVSVRSHGGRLVALKHVKSNVYELTGRAMKLVPLQMPISLVVKSVSGAETAIAINSLKPGLTSSC